MKFLRASTPNFTQDWRDKKDIQKKIDELAKHDFGTGDPDAERSLYIYEVSPLEMKLESIENRKLFREARKFNIRIKDFWKGETGFIGDGEYQLRFQVQQKRRENAEWWIGKILIPIITALIGLAGAITGMIALLKK